MFRRAIFVIAIAGTTLAFAPSAHLPSAAHFKHFGSPIRRDGATPIKTISDLQNMGLTGSYALANDIDASGYAFTPIGDCDSNFFTGSLDGNGFAIKNLSIQSSSDCVGMIGEVGRGGSITNIRLSGVSVTAKEASGTSAMVGAIAGASLGTISQTSAQGTVSAKAAQGALELLVGGLIGSNAGSITFSQTTVAVTTTASGNIFESVGGLVGDNCAPISSNFSVGSVTASVNSAAGGLVGRGGCDVGSISQSFSTASVQAGANSYVGGLVGEILDVSVHQSFATGAVSGTDSQVGGLAGAMGSCSPCSATIEQSYALGSVHAISSGFAGGLVGTIPGAYTGTLSYIDQAYSAGSVISDNGTAGGMIGYITGNNQVTNSYWDLNSSGIGNPNQGCASLVDCPGVTGLTTQQFQDGKLDNVVGFDPTVWEPMRTNALQPSAGYYPQLWALSFPLVSFPLAGLSAYGSANSMPKGAAVITLFDHSLRTSSQAGINGNPLTAALYSVSCDDAVLVFSGQVGLQQYGQDTPTCDEAGYEQDANGDKFVVNGVNYVGDAADGQHGHSPTQYLNYEGHPGIDYAASFIPVYAAVSGVVFYPYRAVGSGQGQTNYDTYCRFHTLAEIPDGAAAYRIYLLHLRTHPNGLRLKGFPPDPPCTVNSYDTVGQQVPIKPVSGCYTLNGQAFMPATLPLPPNTHANAGCQIAVSGDAGVPGAPHLHFEVQQIVPSAAISQTTAGVIQYFQCWNENNLYKDRASSYCLPQDPYGWTYPATACGTVSQWPPNGTYVTDDWACLSSIPSQRYWAQ